MFINWQPFYVFATTIAFDEARKIGDVGVPCYVKEDGTVTLSSADVGLEPMPEGPACGLDGKGC